MLFVHRPFECFYHMSHLFAIPICTSHEIHEIVHDPIHPAGLILELRGCGSGFSGEAGVLLDHTVHVGNSSIDLFDTTGLFQRRFGDLAHKLSALGGVGRQLGKRICSAVNYPGPGMNLVYRSLYKGFRVFGGLRRSKSQITHFVCNHGESRAGLPGSGPPPPRGPGPAGGGGKKFF